MHWLKVETMENNNIMFKIGDTDFSGLTIENYKVQREPQYKAWTDANGAEHRSVYRYQASGSLTLLFEDIETYQGFCRVLAENVQNDTSYPCTVFDNLTDTQITSNFFLSFTPERYRGDRWEDRIKAVQVTIRER